MPDDYRRPTSAFWREWEAVMITTQATLSRYRSHRIKFTVDPVALSYAARQKKYQHKRKAVDRANDQDRQKGGTRAKVSTLDHTIKRRGNSNE